MISRNILHDLQQWKTNDYRKPLILRGARQVGKTTVINLFGSTYDNFLSFNLENRESRRLFEEEEPLRAKVGRMFAWKGLKQNPGDTLIFIDEIQNSPQTIALLRYFYEELPHLHIITAGSLLENLVDVKTSFPVGRVQYLALRPCSFREFAAAMGHERQYEYLREHPEESSSFHETMMSLFNQYTLIGGMPEAVQRYCDHRDALAMDDVYETLLQAYRDDVEKYVRKSKLTEVIRFILAQGWNYAGEIITLGNFGHSGYRSTDVREALQLLHKAMLLETVYPTNSAQMPITPNMRRAPKLIWLDTGLVNYAARIRQEVITATTLQDAWRGRIAEHIVAQELLTLSSKVSETRSFWSKNNGGQGAEVDFVWAADSLLIPIEVKAGHNSHLRSLHSFIDASPYHIAVRVWSGPFQVDDELTTMGKKSFKLINLPFYMVGMLNEIVARV